jgi:hypothetical protein
MVKNAGTETSLYNIGKPLKILINDLSSIETATIDIAIANVMVVPSRLDKPDNWLDIIFI